MISRNAEVYIVDDDEAVLRSLSAILDVEGIPIKAFESVEACLKTCDEEIPGCVVLDMKMPGMDGLQAQGELTKRIQAPIIFLTGHANVPIAVTAMKQGAYDFFEKPVAAHLLIDRVKSALHVQKKNLRQKAEIDAAKARLDLLTPREKEVLHNLLQGMSNKEVAKVLNISPRTIEIHRKNILCKTQAANLIELDHLYQQATGDEVHSAAINQYS